MQSDKRGVVIAIVIAFALVWTLAISLAGSGQGQSSSVEQYTETPRSEKFELGLALASDVGGQAAQRVSYLLEQNEAIDLWQLIFPASLYMCAETHQENKADRISGSASLIERIKCKFCQTEATEIIFHS